MISFLQNLPNLRRLSIILISELIDGYQWEQLIRNYLPKLKGFRLKMENTFDLMENIQKLTDQLFDSFRNSFWTNEHQWFVRCAARNNTIYLYTLSKTSYYYKSELLDIWRSTYPKDDEQEFYSNMTSIYEETFFEQPIPPNIRLPNIDCLAVKFPINDQFWSIVPNLNRLNSLMLYFYTDTFQSQLQALLDRAPHLDSLIIKQDPSVSLQTSLFKYTNVSIHQLDLHGCHHYFNEDECIELSCSPLGVQCEVLLIRVNSLESIIILVRDMVNLRAVNIRYQNHIYRKQSIFIETKDGELKNQDELVQSVKDRLPSTCLVVREPNLTNGILIWI